MKKDINHYQGRYLSMMERDRWEFVTRPNASAVVAIVAVTDQQEIVLVEQYRLPVDSMVIELPAGLVGDQDDKNEPRIEAAARELEEETGYVASGLKILMEAPSSAGMSDEIITFVIADGLRRTGPGGGVDNEKIIVHTIPLTEVDGWLNDQQSAGKQLDPKVFSALYWISQGLSA